ncbi:hypothetical protein PWT90_02820 [Aphanocladium album]|nr:hypothetical protein PWT90_02820 [Aphanocladium album]
MATFYYGEDDGSWNVLNYINSITGWLNPFSDGGDFTPYHYYPRMSDEDYYQGPYEYEWGGATTRNALMMLEIFLGIPIAAGICFIFFVFVVKVWRRFKAWGAARRQQARRRWQALQTRWSPRQTRVEQQSMDDLSSSDTARRIYWREKVRGKLSRNASGGRPDQSPPDSCFVEPPQLAPTTDALRYVGYMV